MPCKYKCNVMFTIPLWGKYSYFRFCQWREGSKEKQVAEGYVTGSPRREGEFDPHACDNTAWRTQPLKMQNWNSSSKNVVMKKGWAPLTWEKLRNQQYCFNWDKLAIVWGRTRQIGRTQHTWVKGKLTWLNVLVDWSFVSPLVSRSNHSMKLSIKMKKVY